MPLVLDGTNGVSGVDGTASNPAIEGTDSNTGIFYPAADTVAIGTGGTERVRVVSAGDVGVGTSTPATISNRTVLSINNASNGGALNLLVNGTETLRLLTDNSSFGYVYNIANQPLVFGTNNTERMRLDASGRLGINQTPNANQGMLQVVGASQSWFRFHDTSAGWNFGTFYRANGTSVLGYLGGGGGNAITGGTADDFVLRSDSALLFAAGGNAERARITSDGYFFINATALPSGITAARFYLRQPSSDYSGVFYSTSSTAGQNYGLYIRYENATPNNTGNDFLIGEDSTNVKVRLTSSGTISNRTGTYNQISDLKLKQDIVDAASQWNDIKALRIVKFRLKDEVAADPNYPAYIGVIAQEVEQVSPGLIDNCPDFEMVEVKDEDGNVTTERRETGTVTKSVKNSIIYMKAVKALQEAMTRIEALEAEVQALKGNA